ncbi:hypothetical protein A8L59_19730 [Pseudomonas koreensis]|uniref:Uncharacterized protein n=1 Tax=Pseudomonas koreensis TaxID=198620 RepID=A0AAC9FXU5_9PSED|nr:hypothetical protein A8L59_19730 [Pseudomonas koreensis]
MTSKWIATGKVNFYIVPLQIVQYSYFLFIRRLFTSQLSTNKRQIIFGRIDILIFNFKSDLQASINNSNIL